MIEDGNFAGWLRVILFLVGLVLTLAGLGLDQMPRWLRAMAFLSGFGMMALGGISSRAHMLKIKPFDNSYQKAHDSYKTSGSEDQDKSR
ncbi:hypothetical protein [Burkholderia ambifaria]|uniref:hypothetical protein n=1 Tax=Burkholderia ambifaria TaxID=152480 RepID=UPI0012FD9F34|nr:hypothetical protein [Burkholderia ambifaria]UEP52382.1 hypothetical protein LMA00_31630 [Burkholderia ambifaria]